MLANLNITIKLLFNLIVFGICIIDCVAMMILPGMTCRFLITRFVKALLPFLKILLPIMSSITKWSKKPSGYFGGSTVSGGICNISTGSYSTIGGGCGNSNTGLKSTISGGSNNTASSYNGGSTIGGGICNTSCGDYSLIGGGCCNINCGLFSTISGGSNNFILDGGSTIGGGRCNISTGSYSAILGGICNTTNGCDCSMIVGACISANRVFTTFVNNLSIMNIPTSSVGLPSGAVWRNGTVLEIIP